MEPVSLNPCVPKQHLPEDPGHADTKLILSSWLEQEGLELWSQTWIGMLGLPLIY